MNRGCRLFIAILVVAAVGGMEQVRGEHLQSPAVWTLDETLQGTFDSSGQILKMDSSITRTFKEQFTGSLGLPVYSSRGASLVSTTTNQSFVTGMGNAYLGLGFSHAGDKVDYASNLIVTAPTGDRDKGFSTGHVTVDWSNVFQHRISAVTPFASFGLANTISDTSFFIRPFSSQGLVTHWEGGARLEVTSAVTVDGSYYAIVASGNQRIVSKLVTHTTPSASGNGKGKKVFETLSDTTVTASDANDRGFSASVTVQAHSALDLSAGYSRSTAYGIDGLFFGIHYSLNR